MKAQGFARTLMAAAIGFTMSSAAVAQGAVDSGLTISVGGAYNMFDSVRHVDNDVAPEFGLGYRFNDRFSVEGVYSKSATDVKNAATEIDLKEYRLDAYLDLTPWDGSYTPYVVAGASMFDMDDSVKSHDETRMHAGIGLRKAITPNLSVRGDVRAIRSLDYQQTESAVNLALTWTFGSVAEPVVEVAPVVVEEPVVIEEPVVLDGDNDGIVDANDLCMNTVPGVAVDAVGCEQIDAKVLFNFNSASLRAEDLSIVAETGQFLQRNPALSMKIVGYADSIGSSAYNQKLSMERAGAVRAALVAEFGIDASRIEVSAMGSQDPAASNDTAQGREDNRRVTMVTFVPQA